MGIKNANPLIDVLVDAITGSGKEFNQIDKKSIFDYLKKSGIDQNKFESIYEELSNVYNPSKKSSNKERKPSVVSVVDYADSSHNDVKLRQPRKSIFSEIKKIAG